MRKFLYIVIALIALAYISGIGILISDFYLEYLPIAHSPQYPVKVSAVFMALTALATLFLAVATFVIVIFNRKQENRRRKEGLLHEILEWAINVGKYMLSRNLPPFEKHCIDKYNEYLDEALEGIVIAKYTEFRMQIVYIAEISKGIPKIECLVNDAIRHLRDKLRLLNRYNEGYNNICEKSGELKAARNIGRNEDRLYNYVVEIIKKIGNISRLD